MKKKFKLIIFIILCLSFVNCVYASTTTYDRNSRDNYGVNKKWKINSGNKDNVLNTPLVDADEKIYDFSDILTDEEEKHLKNKIDEFIDKTGMDVVILTNNLPYSYDEENEDYAADFYDYNDFGIDFDNYSGVILFRNTYSSPYYGAYWFGDAQLYYKTRTDSILDDIYYDIKNGNYRNGFDVFLNRLDTYYDDGIPYEMKNYYIDDMGYLKRKYVFPWMTAFLVAGIGTAIIMSILIKKNKMIRKAAEASNYLNKDSVKYSVKNDILVGSHTTHYTVSSSSGGGGGHSSSSGSSGGGHSGGGRHG